MRETVQEWLLVVAVVYLPLTPIWLYLGFIPWLWTVGVASLALIGMAWSFGAMYVSAAGTADMHRKAQKVSTSSGTCTENGGSET